MNGLIFSIISIILALALILVFARHYIDELRIRVDLIILDVLIGLLVYCLLLFFFAWEIPTKCYGVDTCFGYGFPVHVIFKKVRDFSAFSNASEYSYDIGKSILGKGALLRVIIDFIFFSSLVYGISLIRKKFYKY